jgi:hypothetical protein
VCKLSLDAPQPHELRDSGLGPITPRFSSEKTPSIVLK